jgi:UDP-N-acetyl-D-glucosamine dehydrogenase
VELVSHGLSRQGKPLSGASVLVLGVAFKRDIDDARNSPAERIIELLLSGGARVTYHDSYVPSFRVGGNVFHHESVTLESAALTDDTLAAVDCVIIVTDHLSVDYERVVKLAKLIVDTRNTTAGVPGYEEKIVRLGAPLSR